MGCRTGGMQDRWDAGQAGCRKEEIQDMWDANLVLKWHKLEKTTGKAGFGTDGVQDMEGYRKRVI